MHAASPRRIRQCWHRDPAMTCHGCDAILILSTWKARSLSIDDRGFVWMPKIWNTHVAVLIWATVECLSWPINLVIWRARLIRIDYTVFYLPIIKQVVAIWNPANSSCRSQWCSCYLLQWLPLEWPGCMPKNQTVRTWKFTMIRHAHKPHLNAQRMLPVQWNVAQPVNHTPSVKRGNSHRKAAISLRATWKQLLVRS